jgi:hypothetical protein
VLELDLWATGLASGCNNVYAAYYTAGNAVIGESPLLPVRPMIQQVRESMLLALRAFLIAIPRLCRSDPLESRPI